MASIKTPEAVLSYPNLFTPKADDDGNLNYSCALVFLEGTDITALKQAAVETLVEAVGEKKAKAGLASGEYRLPFRTDATEKGYPEGSIFINVKTRKKPGIVSIYPDPNNNGKPKVIDDEDEIYPGIFVYATLTPFFYDRKGNRGVSFRLNNLQKLRDGERLDGRARAEDEFEADAEAAAALEALIDNSAQEDAAPVPSKGKQSKGGIDLTELLK